VKFLLDEHLSPTLVSYIASLGCYGAAVPHVGLSGASDRAVWRYASQGITLKTWGNRDFRLNDNSGNEIKFTEPRLM
jgi:predicted nuclease of predicted toxin-antitoxin system